MKPESNNGSHHKSSGERRFRLSPDFYKELTYQLMKDEGRLDTRPGSPVVQYLRYLTTESENDHPGDAYYGRSCIFKLLDSRDTVNRLQTGFEYLVHILDHTLLEYIKSLMYPRFPEDQFIRQIAGHTGRRQDLVQFDFNKQLVEAFLEMFYSSEPAVLPDFGTIRYIEWLNGEFEFAPSKEWVRLMKQKGKN